MVCDIAVPADVSLEVSLQSPLITVMRGGLVKLPRNEDFLIAGLDLEPGYVFACMAETLLMGLEGATSSVSFGSIKPEGVNWALQAAQKHGFALGKLELATASAEDLGEMKVAHA